MNEKNFPKPEKPSIKSQTPNPNHSAKPATPTPKSPEPKSPPAPKFIPPPSKK